MNTKLQSVMAKNGFNRYFALEDETDYYGNCIRYETFGAQTIYLTDFERYLQLNMLSHNAIPAMSDGYKQRIIDSFLEIFNNVIDHAQTDKVYVCGQIYPQKRRISFSIVDIGTTIETKVNDYFNLKNQIIPENCINWAIQKGNSTKMDTPGGIGFPLLIEFSDYNEGSLIIISGHEYYERKFARETNRSHGISFPGTCVTLELNMNDDKLYMFDEEEEETIVF